MARKTQQRTLLTRNRILDAARDLAGQENLDAVTAEAIAEAAGVAKGTVFAHFGDMDGLLSYLLLDRLRELLLANTEQGHQNAAAAPPQELGELDPVQLILSKMMRLISVITSSQIILRLFLENTGATKGHCAPEFVEVLDQLDAELNAFLTIWQSTPTIRPALRGDRTPEELTDGLIAFMIYGAIVYRSHQLTSLAQLEERLVRHVDAFLLDQNQL